MNIAFFTKSWPRHNHNGSLEKVISFIQSLVNNNHKIAVCSAQQNLQTKQPLKQYPLQIIDINSKKISNSLNLFAKHQFKPNMFVFDSPETEQMYSAFLYNRWNKVSRVLMINQLDALSKWRKQNYKLVPNTILPDDSYLAPSSIQEIISPKLMRSISRCDHVITSNQYAYYLLSTLMFNENNKNKSSINGNSNASKYISQINCSFLMDQFYTQCRNLQFRPFRNRKNFVFIGNFQQDNQSFSSQSNVDCIFILINFIWPLIRSKLGNQNKPQLHIYGTCGNSGIYYEKLQQYFGKNTNFTKENLKKMGVVIKGKMAQPETLSEYKSLLYPCVFSTGSHVKVIESWFMHLPVVTTPIGAESLYLQNFNPVLSTLQNMNVFASQRTLSQSDKQSASKVANYFKNRKLSKQQGQGIFTFGGSYNNFTYKQFADSAVKIYENQQYWNKCLQNAHKIIKRNHDETHNQVIVKKAMVNIEISTYEGRSRASYQNQWKRYTKSNEFNKKLRG